MHSYISRGLAISILPFHHNCLHLSLLRAHEGPVGLDETGEMGGCFPVCQPVPELPICACKARACTVCWVSACFAVLFFFFLIRMSGKDTFSPRLPPPLPSCFTFKDDLFY